jgi:hypothetical protein
MVLQRHVLAELCLVDVLDLQFDCQQEVQGVLTGASCSNKYTHIIYKGSQTGLS